MSRDRFSAYGTTRINISDGDWIEVKAGLSAGEQRIQDSLAVVPVKLPDGSVVDKTDWSMYEFLRTDLWITDWSLSKTLDGKTTSIPKSVAALRALEPDDFEEINMAVYTHIVAWIASKKKKALERTPDASKSAPTSQS